MIFELVILVGTLYVLWAVADNFFPSKKLPPGPFRWPILGNTLTFVQHRDKPPFVMFRDLSKTYGPVTFLGMGFQPAILTGNFDLSKQLLNSEVWIDRPFNGLDAERSFGKPLGIIFVGGEGWRQMRRFSMRTLRDQGFKNLEKASTKKNLLTIILRYGKQANMQSVIDDEVGLLLKKVEQDTTSDPILSLKHLFTMPVLNNLWSMVSSTERTAAGDAKLKELALIVDKLSRATAVGGSIVDLYPELRHVAPGVTGVTFIRECVRELQGYFRDVLNTRRKEGGWKEEGRDFIDMFIKEIVKHEKAGSNPNHYTDEQFITTITDLFEAGSETSSNTLEFAIYFIMKTPRVQRKVQEEIDRVVGQSRLPSMTDKAEMPYTEATLLEVQRMANVLPMTARACTEDCTVGGYFIAKGTAAIVNIYGLHMDTSFWGDSFVFRPERFLNEKNEIIAEKASRVIAFGAGKRVCLGEQMARTTLFSYFTALLQNFNFEDILERKYPQLDSSIVNKSALGAYCSESLDPEKDLFQKTIHVGFTLSINPVHARVTKRQ